MSVDDKQSFEHVVEKIEIKWCYIELHSLFGIRDKSEKGARGIWYAACNYSLARVYRGLCCLVCIAEWKRVTTNTNCLHPQGKKKSTPQIRRAGGLRIHSFPFRFQVEVFLSVRGGGKLLKLATVVAVLENVSVLLLPWILSPWILRFRNCSLLIDEQAFLCPYKLRDSASPARWTGLKYIFFATCIF